MFRYLLPVAAMSVLVQCGSLSPNTPRLEIQVQQITEGPLNHYFGYIGHVQNIPWNASERYILTLEVPFVDRAPTADDTADILLIDTQDGYRTRKVAETRAWNPQQGSMMYWNPAAPETEFFFNDRDPETNHVFAVLFDVEQGRRIREYRFDDTPVGNGGVRQNGGSFLAINYGRMARLRPVTGYADAYDWNPEDAQPENDGVFLIDIESGEKKLLASFARMRDLLQDRHPRVAEVPLFINHTLWNRDGDRIFFFVRGDFSNREARVNIPMTMRSNGSDLHEQAVFIGGHPEWESGSRLIGHAQSSLVLYDSQTMEIVEKLGDSKVFPDPENDVALSSDGEWIVQGLEEGPRTAYTVYRRADEQWARTGWYDQHPYTSGDLRIDPAPKWNRSSSAFLFSSLTEGDEPTRQLYLATVAGATESSTR